MHILPGGDALSAFRRTQLLNRIQSEVAGIRSLEAVYVHFVDLDQALKGRQRATLGRLLTYGDSLPRELPVGELVLVIPRPGTVSPWSSKATDIAHNCGLSVVHRIERGTAFLLDNDTGALDPDQWRRVSALVHDRMTQAVCAEMGQAEILFRVEEPVPAPVIDLSEDPCGALRRANARMGLALSDEEIDYLVGSYLEIGRHPTDVELMMFAQANSEHCRHKIFNADWVIDGVRQDKTLFQMIQNTYEHAPQGILSAYRDNSAVMEGGRGRRLLIDPASGYYESGEEDIAILMKVETHNHPTAISPFPGAATGAGGEIRDEGATGRGGKPKAGLCGFSVSNLRIPGFIQPWEGDFGRPPRIASAREIMLEGPIGAAAYNNEFGRPNLCGYFRTFEERVPGPTGEELRGYHKPIMVAGGMGNIRPRHVKKRALPAGTPIVVLGGPAMLIGLGGGAASSMASGSSSEALDFASVQRGNPEVERRCQEVIDHCFSDEAGNPILAIHDVGAGGLSNAVPEIVHDAGRGGRFELRMIPTVEPGMSPMEIWCNEAQERYVLAIDAGRLVDFQARCDRERCPYAVIGEATEEESLVVGDGYFDDTPVNVPLELLLGKPPKMLREVHHHPFPKPDLDYGEIDLADAAERVLRLPAVAAKGFLITIGDRSITGMVTRDQMVGPWQVPVADVAVTCADYHGYRGEAMAMGERAPVALTHAPASGRMAVGEALTNMAAAAIDDIGQIRLSANWMAAAGHPGEDAALFETVRAVGEELCPALGIAIPVGKDSLSMKTVWSEGGETREVTAPLSLIISAFAPVSDVRHTLTPRLRLDCGETELIFVDLGHGANRLGGSALAQVYRQVGHHGPDLDGPQALKDFFAVIQDLNRERRILAYHDRSDGGLFATVCEMAFAGHAGLVVDLDPVAEHPVPALFSEELGAVIQVRARDAGEVWEALRGAGLGRHSHVIGIPDASDTLEFRHHGAVVYTQARSRLHRIWAETSYRMQALRDNPECARQEFEACGDPDDPGLCAHVGFLMDEDVAAPYIATGVRPEVAILREQGVNGEVEMAAAFEKAGFCAVDIHMSDIIEGRRTLEDFKGLAACGGFSYGDVLGAGGGWAKSILHNSRAKAQFEAFFQRRDTFALGVCNGCQMLAQLHELIPGAPGWPAFVRNDSEQFEARLVMVEVLPSPSILLREMQGAILPVVVAHGEGRARFTETTPETVMEAGLVSLRYLDHHGAPTTRYPCNPNGSPLGITGLSNCDGRVTIMMPHPERLFRTVQHSWHPPDWGEESPWLRMFRNARVWVS